jgi:hypothetical protein
MTKLIGPFLEPFVTKAPKTRAYIRVPGGTRIHVQVVQDNARHNIAHVKRVRHISRFQLLPQNNIQF